jgi:hypothetical protein
MERRKFILGAGALAAGGAAAIGSGAFSQAEVRRNATVAVGDDSGSLVGLEPVDTDRAKLNDNGNIEFDFATGRDDTEFALNANSQIQFDRVFRVKNNNDTPIGFAVGGQGDNGAAGIYPPGLGGQPNNKKRLGLLGDNTDISLNFIDDDADGQKVQARVLAGQTGDGTIGFNTGQEVRFRNVPGPSNPDTSGSSRFLDPGESVVVNVQFNTGPNPTLDAKGNSFFNASQADIVILAGDLTDPSIRPE